MKWFVREKSIQAIEKGVYSAEAFNLPEGLLDEGYFDEEHRKLGGLGEY